MRSWLGVRLLPFQNVYDVRKVEFAFLTQPDRVTARRRHSVLLLNQLHLHP
jgi:hypothetical protein